LKEFGIEGFSLWLFLQHSSSGSVNSSGSNSPLADRTGLSNSSATSSSSAFVHADTGSLIRLKLIKSSLINNPSMSAIEHICLNGEHEIYACLNLSRLDDLEYLKRYEPENRSKYNCPPIKLGGNSIWQILNCPLTYLGANFPIRVIYLLGNILLLIINF
jgi:hypothetical protein